MLKHMIHIVTVVAQTAEWMLPSIGSACNMSYRLLQELPLVIARCQLPLYTCWYSDLLGHRVLSLCRLFPVPWSFTRILTTSLPLADLLSPLYTRRFPLCNCQRPSECYCSLHSLAVWYLHLLLNNNPSHTPTFSLPICWAPCPARQQAPCTRSWTKALFARTHVSYVVIRR